LQIVKKLAKQVTAGLTNSLLKGPTKVGQADGQTQKKKNRSQFVEDITSSPTDGQSLIGVEIKKIQLTPAPADFKGPAIFICYRRIFVIANIEIKERD